MKFRGFKFLRWFGINGIVLYPFILFSDRNPDVHILKHEEIHWQQIKSFGVMNFYFRYLKEYFISRLKGETHFMAYMNISFEREAYKHQKNPTYVVDYKTREKA